MAYPPLPNVNSLLSQIGASGNPIFIARRHIPTVDLSSVDIVGTTTSTDSNSDSSEGIRYGGNFTPVPPPLPPDFHRPDNAILAILLFLERVRQATFDTILTANESIQASRFVDSETIDFIYDILNNAFSAEIKEESITTELVADEAITFTKLPNIAGKVLLGKDSGVGPVELIQLGAGLSLNSGVLSSTSIADFDKILVDASGNVVTSDGFVLINS